MRALFGLVVAVAVLAAAPAHAQLSGFPQGSVSPDQAIQSFGADEDAKAGSNQGFNTPDFDPAGATNYEPPSSPYTGNSYQNSGEVCVTCTDDNDDDTGGNSDDNNSSDDD